MSDPIPWIEPALLPTIPTHLCIRRRPGIYIGGTSPRALREIPNYLIDDLLTAPGAAFTRVTTTLLPEHEVQLEFLGTPPQLEPANFVTDAMPRDWRHLSLNIANALSERLTAQVIRNGQGWSQSFAPGTPIDQPRQLHIDAPDHIQIRFRPDPAIFKRIGVDFLPYCGRTQERAIFFPSILFRVDCRTASPQVRDYSYPHGLVSYVQELEYDRVKSADQDRIFKLELAEGSERAQVVIMRHWGDYRPASFANTLRTPGGGTHVEGFETAFGEIVKQHANDPTNAFQSWITDPPLSGMTVLISVQLDEPEYCGSTKDRLFGERPRDLVYRMVRSQLPQQIAATLSP